jgi:transposase InsO family protein
VNAEKKRLEKEIADSKDYALILKAFEYQGYDKGARGINMRLLRFNPPVVMNVKKISRLMKKFNLKCHIRKVKAYRRIHKASQQSIIAPNILNRRFRTNGARTVLLTDITYIPRRKTAKDKNDQFTYLAVILDAFTKELLAFSISTSPKTDFILELVKMLLENHGDELKTDTLIHSDQGCQYTSNSFVELLRDGGLRQSMSRRGNCWDNAPQESFFGHMKDEITLCPSYDHWKILKKLLVWLENYNNDRPQWELEKLTPVEYHEYVKTGVYPLSTKTENVLKREELLVDGMTVEKLIIEEEKEKFLIKAEKRKLKKMAENSGIRPLNEPNDNTEDERL